MRIEYEHKLTKEEAYRKANELLNNLQRQYGDMINNTHINWNNSNDIMNFSFRVSGFDVEGIVQLYNGLIIVYGKMPFLARPFQGKIESAIRQKLEESI